MYFIASTLATEIKEDTTPVVTMKVVLRAFCNGILLVIMEARIRMLRIVNSSASLVWRLSGCEADGMVFGGYR